MAIITKITQPGNRIISSLDGKVRFEQGRNRIAVSDSATGGHLGQIDGDGFKTFDPTDGGKEKTRTGRLPDKSYTTAAANQGESIEDGITP